MKTSKTTRNYHVPSLESEGKRTMKLETKTVTMRSAATMSPTFEDQKIQKLPTNEKWCLTKFGKRKKKNSKVRKKNNNKKFSKNDRNFGEPKNLKVAKW